MRRKKNKKYSFYAILLLIFGSSSIHIQELPMKLSLTKQTKKNKHEWE